jgi:hypothetical protein
VGVLALTDARISFVPLRRPAQTLDLPLEQVKKAKFFDPLTNGQLRIKTTSGSLLKFYFVYDGGCSTNPRLIQERIRSILVSAGRCLGRGPEVSSRAQVGLRLSRESSRTG